MSPELVDVTRPDAPTSKWQQPFDAALTDVFQVQSDIATKVAQALNVALGAGEEKRLSEKPTQNLAAYDAYLKGVEVVHNTGVGAAAMRKALGYFEQAVALDPGFARAWEGVSGTTAHLYLGTPMPQLAERSRQAAEKAVALAPERPGGYLALGFYQYFVLGDANGALAQYAKGAHLAPVNADLFVVSAGAEAALGRWDAALEHLRQAERLDPRSLSTQRRLAEVLLLLRRYSEARETIDRALALAPANLTLIVDKTMTFLEQGDLAGARAVLKAAPKEVEPTALVAEVATELGGWVLDEGQRELLLRLTPSAFDDNKGDWAFSLAEIYTLKGDVANAHVYAEEARKELEEQLRVTPHDATVHARLGLALAYLGREEEAIREGQRGVALVPEAKDSVRAAGLQGILASIYIRVGATEKALDLLELLLKIPGGGLSPGWLKVDPEYEPLRQNPRFRKLVASGK